MTQISELSDVLITIPCYLGYTLAADKFCKKFLKSSKRNEILFVIFLFIGLLLMITANERYIIPYIVLMMINHTLLIGLTILLFQADIEKKLLAASIIVAATRLTGDFCESFLSCLALIFQHTVKKIPEPFLGVPEIYIISYIRFAAVIFVIIVLSGHMNLVFQTKIKRWYLMTAVLMLIVTAINDIAGWGASNSNFVRSGGNMGLYYDQLFSHTQVCVLTTLSAFAAGFYVFGMNRIYLEQEKSSQYRYQITAYKMLEEQHNQSERLRHDMKNHIIALSGLHKNNEWSKMGEYLSNMEEKGSFTVSEEITGNKVVDAILCHKRQLAQDKGIIWESDVQIPKECCINEFDLCVLFGNILDNAIEACEKITDSKKRFISIQARAVKRCYLLEVKNSADIAEKQKPDYGIGLLNVSDVTNSYNGIVNIEVRNNIFIISILIPLN